MSKVKVALDLRLWSIHTGLYVAREKGYYQAEGLDVEIEVPKRTSVLRGVGSGSFDFGIAYLPQVLFARALDAPLPVVSVSALVQHPLNSVITLKESGITRPRQLKGKRIGVTGVDFEEALLSTMLASDGIGLEDVERVQVGYNIIASLTGKEVDAVIGGYWVRDATILETQGYPVNVIRMEEWGVPDFYELVLVANDSTASRFPKLVQRFLRATAIGYRYAAENPKEAAAILVKANPHLNPELEAQAIALLAPLWLEGRLPFGSQSPQKWRDFAQWMRQANLLDEKVDVDKAFNSSLSPSRNERR